MFYMLIFPPVPWTDHHLTILSLSNKFNRLIHPFHNPQFIWLIIKSPEPRSFYCPSDLYSAHPLIYTQSYLVYKHYQSTPSFPLQIYSQNEFWNPKPRMIDVNQCCLKWCVPGWLTTVRENICLGLIGSPLFPTGTSANHGEGRGGNIPRRRVFIYPFHPPTSPPPSAGDLLFLATYEGIK